MEQEIGCGKCGALTVQMWNEMAGGPEHKDYFTCGRCRFAGDAAMHIQERDRRIEAATVAMLTGAYAGAHVPCMTYDEAVTYAVELIDALDAAAQRRTGGAE